MVGKEPEGLALGVNGRLLLKRVVFEMKGEFGGNPVSTRKLDEAARGESVIVHVPQHEKTVKPAFDMAHRYLIGGQRKSRQY
jgi:hypothetical protein